MASCKGSSGNNFSAKKGRLWPLNPDISHGELLEVGSSGKEIILHEVFGFDGHFRSADADRADSPTTRQIMADVRC